MSDAEGKRQVVGRQALRQMQKVGTFLQTAIISNRYAVLNDVKMSALILNSC